MALTSINIFVTIHMSPAGDQSFSFVFKKIQGKGYALQTHSTEMMTKANT